MFTCEECGQDGACFCSASDNLGNAAGEFLHPLCYAKRGIVTHEDFKRIGRNRSHGLSHAPSIAVRQVRVAVRYPVKPASQPLRRL